MGRESCIKIYHDVSYIYLHTSLSIYRQFVFVFFLSRKEDRKLSNKQAPAMHTISHLSASNRSLSR